MHRNLDPHHCKALSPASEGRSCRYTSRQSRYKYKKRTTAQERGSSSGQSQTGDRPRRPNLRQLFLGGATRLVRAATASPPRGVRRPRDRAPRSCQSPANSRGPRAGGFPASTRPRAPGRRRPVASVSRAAGPPPGHLSDLHSAAAGDPGQSRSSPRPQPARRRVRPHLTATRTELSSGAPHMPAAGDNRAPGPLHRRTEAPPEPRRSRAGGWSCRGRTAHLRRAPAMLGD